MGNINPTPEHGKTVTSKQIHFSDLKEILQIEISEWHVLITSMQSVVTSKQKITLRDKMQSTQIKLSKFLTTQVYFLSIVRL